VIACSNLDNAKGDAQNDE